MAINTQFLNAQVWQNLDNTVGQCHTQAVKTSTGSTIHPADNLPSIAPTGPEWKSFTASKANAQPYVASLGNSVNTIHQFIEGHAAAGEQKTLALLMLREFEATKIKCRPTSLTPLMVNENRRNLQLIAGQLQNPHTPLEKRVGAALDLAQGLNVCTEGATLNILNCASELVQQQQGLAGVVSKVKNELIDQHLLQLVKQQASRYMNSKLASQYEIHHVQALKNHVAQDWGLTPIEDRYATQAFQKQAGAMATALLEKTATPHALAALVAEKLEASFMNFTSSSLKTGMPSSELKTQALNQAIQAEFGSAIELERCLEFNEDYTEVKLKPGQALVEHVLEGFQQLGLISADHPASHFMEQAICPVEQGIEEVKYLQGEPEKRTSSYSSSQNMCVNTAFWFGSSMPLQAVGDKEKERKKSTMHQQGANQV